MIECPEFDVDPSLYIILMDIITLLSLLVHPYVIYCIVFRSTYQMSKYRWYLLWHQVLSCLGDLWINCVTRPVILFPLPAGYLKGIANRVVSPQQALAIGQLFICTACVSAIHLFCYRYLAVNGKTSYPWWCKLLMVYNYITPLVNYGLTATASSDTEETLKEWQQEYTCVTPSVVAIPNLWAYDKAECLRKSVGVMAFDCINFTVWMTFFIHATRRAIGVQIISNNLRAMHRKFLFQLILQAAIPTVLIVIPSGLFATALTFDLIGLKYLNEIIMICLSLFGVSGGLVLLVMNPSYRDWFSRRSPPSSVLTRCSLFV